MPSRQPADRQRIGGRAAAEIDVGAALERSCLAAIERPVALQVALKHDRPLPEAAQVAHVGGGRQAGAASARTRYSIRTGEPASAPRTVPTSDRPLSRWVSVQCSSVATSSERRHATRLVATLRPRSRNAPRAILPRPSPLRPAILRHAAGAILGPVIVRLFLLAAAAVAGILALRRRQATREAEADASGAGGNTGMPGGVQPEGARALVEAVLGQRPQRRPLSIDFAPATATAWELLIDGPAFFPRMLADIEAAQSDVHIIIFGFKAGEIGSRFRDLLIKKVGEGIPVRLMVEGFYSQPGLGSRALYRDASRGWRADRGQPGRLPRSRRPAGRAHRSTGGSMTSAISTTARSSSSTGAWRSSVDRGSRTTTTTSGSTTSCSASRARSSASCRRSSCCRGISRAGRCRRRRGLDRYFPVQPDGQGSRWRSS